jgi:hypothetical protein
MDEQAREDISQLGEEVEGETLTSGRKKRGVVGKWQEDGESGCENGQGDVIDWEEDKKCVNKGCKYCDTTEEEEGLVGGLELALRAGGQE